MPTSGCDVAVVGAGPAGAAAAVTAVRAGARVVLVDAEARPGGQYWRHGPGDGSGDGSGHVRGSGQVHEHAREWRALARRLDHALGSGRLTHLPRTRVWRIDPPSAGGPARLQATTPDADGADAPVVVEAAAVVLAPGAHDRVLPFPGWDLPGVLTAGGAQALLKEHGVAAGRRAVVAGTGPFLLPVAVGHASGDATLHAYAWTTSAPKVAEAILDQAEMEAPDCASAPPPADADPGARTARSVDRWAGSGWTGVRIRTEVAGPDPAVGETRLVRSDEVVVLVVAAGGAPVSRVVDDHLAAVADRLG